MSKYWKALFHVPIAYYDWRNASLVSHIAQSLPYIPQSSKSIEIEYTGVAEHDGIQ